MILREMFLGFGVDAEMVDPVLLFDLLDNAAFTKKPYHVLILDHRLLMQKKADLVSLQNDSGWQGKMLAVLPKNGQFKQLTAASLFTDVGVIYKPVRRLALQTAVNRLLNRTVPEEKGNTEKSATVGKTRKILLVEDMTSNQILATEILRRTHYEVVVANHGGEALEILAKAPFDLILMDLQMPLMDGYETTRRIREDDGTGLLDPDVPIVAVTAKALDGEEEKCLAAGMDGYLRKPYRVKELLAVLETSRRKVIHPKERYADVGKLADIAPTF